MKEKPTGKQSRKAATDWNRVRSLSASQIRKAVKADPDARPTDPGFWKTAQLVMPRPKQTVTLRLDADLLDWLRRERGYQTRINAVLRSYMEANLPQRGE